MDWHKIDQPNQDISPASKMLIPLLDALQWVGDPNRVQLFKQEYGYMTTDNLLDTMAAFNFQHNKILGLSGKDMDPRWLPVLVVHGEDYKLVIKMNDKEALAYTSQSGNFEQMPLKEVKGDMFMFQYASDFSDSTSNVQENWFNKVVMRFKRALGSMMILTFMITMLDLLIPLFMILIYDQMGYDATLNKTLILGGGVVLYFGASIMLGLYRGWLTTYVSSRLGNIISQQTFRKLMYLPPSYTETASTSSQINRIRDFENLKRFISSGIFINLLELCYSLIYILAMFFIGGWIGFIPIVTFVLVMFLGWILQPLHKTNVDLVINASAELQHNHLEILRNMSSIRTSGMKERWLEHHKEAAATSLMRNYEQYRYVSLTNNLIYFVTNASVVLVIYGGALKAFDGLMSVGALIGVILLYWRILAAIRGASSLIVQVNGLKKSILQVNRFMKLPSDTNAKSQMLMTQKLKGHVQFKDVSIRYSKTSKAALVNLNFSAEPGEIVGITGHDGSGKTTILKLILGMYLPQGGRVMIDGYNLKQLEPLSLRQGISYSSERDMLLKGSIRSNFISINPSITDRDIMELIEQTGMQYYMNRYRLNLDTVLDELMLETLSPSFKKIFCLTRMLARDVALYLVDEPENHLSKDELSNIIHVFKGLTAKGKTVIITTKSSWIVEVCDHILLLNRGKGKLVEKGEVYEEKEAL